MNARRILLFSGVGIVAYVLFLALTLPAAVLFDWVLPAQGSVTVVAPQGTPWHGHADQLRIDDAPIGRINWSVHPWALFTGQLDYDLRVRGEITELSAEAVLTPDGKVVVTDLRGPLPVSTAMQWMNLPLPPNSASGQLMLDLDRFVFAHRRPTAIVGRIGLAKLHALWPTRMRLGDYIATFTTNKDGIHGHARDTGGPIALDAKINVNNQGHYQTHGTLKARGNADPSLEQAIRFIGQTDQGGTTHFSFGGSLKL